MFCYRLVFCCIVLLQAASGYAVDFAEGEWEVVVKQDIGGLGVGNPAVHYRECLTQESPIPKAFLYASECEVKEKHVLHRTLSWKMTCQTEHGRIYNEGSIRFHTFKISGQSRTLIGDTLGKNTTLRYTFNGRRIGECHP